MREVVDRCDICGEAGESVKTYRVIVDGETWEVDLDDKTDGRHSKAMHILIQKGRKRLVSATDSKPRTAIAGLERRIRGIPQEA